MHEPKHTAKRYAEMLDELRPKLSKKHRQWLLDLWRDYQASSVDKGARIMVAFDEKTEWLTAEETRRFVYLVRGFGFDIINTGHPGEDMPPELMSFAYHAAKGLIPDLKFAPLASAGDVAKQQTHGA